MPSFRTTPNLSFLGMVTSRQGIGSALGSLSQGCASTTDLANRVRSDRFVPIGPTHQRSVSKQCPYRLRSPLTLLTDSCPASPEVQPAVGNRPNDGRSVKMPVADAGILKEPPMSVPTPRGLPRNANNADSPPELPPGVSVRRRGFSVLHTSTRTSATRQSRIWRTPISHLPKVLFTLSGIIIAVGTFVLT